MTLKFKIKRSISKKSKSSEDPNNKPLILESIGYLKTHETDVEQQVYERVHINEIEIKNVIIHI